MPLNKRLIIIGILLVVLGVLFFRGGDEPTERRTADVKPAPTPPVPARPEARPSPAPGVRDRDWYSGYYSGPDYAPPPPARPRDEPSGSWYRDPYAGSPYAGPSAPPPAGPERYRFRPLDERERARIEAATPMPDYGYPYYSTPERPREDRAREQRRWDAYPAEPYPQQTYPGWHREGYGYRPPERSSSPARPGTPWDLSPDYGNAWTLPTEPPSGRPAPAWDLPPTGRMYPSLPIESDRRFSVR